MLSASIILTPFLVSIGNQTASKEQIQRLVDWNSDVLIQLLKQVVGKRMASGKEISWDEEPVLQEKQGQTILDEVTEVIDLPGFTQNCYYDPDFIDLPPGAEDQLRDYVRVVANAYHNENAFHCLHHASSVTTALTKLLSRILVKDLTDLEEYENEDDCSDSESEPDVTDAIASHLHSHTYGITSDPLSQFALVLSAFLHAVDHRGLPNHELVKEEPEEAARYKNRSVTEQRSVEKAWAKLMEPQFKELRQSIYVDETELQRFRQVVVNSVLATDMLDEELQLLRRKRWEKTLNKTVDTTPEDVNRKATIVLEHLIQAANIHHSMQSWVVFEKWSNRLFEERYQAFKSGRSTNDPSLTWYDDQLQMFDNIAIPLAMQLKDCDAFVVAPDDILDYAVRNRRQWSSVGNSVVLQLVDKLSAGRLETDQSPDSRDTPIIPLEGNDVEIDRTKQFQRLVDWNVDMLQGMIKAIVAKRIADGIPAEGSASSLRLDFNLPIDEVQEVIELAEFSPASAVEFEGGVSSIDLSLPAMEELREFIADIAKLAGNNNSYHCFDKCSQVSMTLRRKLARLVSSVGVESTENESVARIIHNRTFGISSDPLAQFAVVFAGLVMDINSQGVPNSQLAREGHSLAERYNNRCISQQNSIETAWNHLMQPQFETLRSYIYSNETELRRFRQILVNSVLATDFGDEKLMELRKKRWDDAFFRSRSDTSIENTNRKATAVLELMLQDADIFHTTQSWMLYQKWSERQFQELYKAYQTGRLMQDPSVFWYKSELLFFDEHVIPLAKRLTECGVFDSGRSNQNENIDADEGDQFINFALMNRQHWATKGPNIVASMMARYHGKEVENARAKRVHRRMSLSAKQA